MSVDGEFVQGIRDCTEVLRSMTEIMSVCRRELDEAVRQMTSLQWKTEPLQVTLEEAGKMLSLSKAKVRSLIAKGEIESTGKHTGRRVVVESIHAYVAREARASHKAALSYDNPFGVKAHVRRSRMRYVPFKEVEPPDTHINLWNNGPFKCKKCGRGFNSERGLKVHERRPGLFHR